MSSYPTNSNACFGFTLDKNAVEPYCTKDVAKLVVYPNSINRALFPSPSTIIFGLSVVLLKICLNHSTRICVLLWLFAEYVLYKFIYRGYLGSRLTILLHSHLVYCYWCLILGKRQLFHLILSFLLHYGNCWSVRTYIHNQLVLLLLLQ